MPPSRCRFFVGAIRRNPYRPDAMQDNSNASQPVSLSPVPGSQCRLKQHNITDMVGLATVLLCRQGQAAVD